MIRSKSVLVIVASMFLLLFGFLSLDRGAQVPPPPGSGHIGVYLTSYAISNQEIMAAVFAAREAGKIDALVINVKNMYGEVTYRSKIPFVREIGAAVDRIDLARLIPELRARGFYLIARQVVFYDPILARRLGTDGSWVSPEDETAVSYNLSIANEVANLGFDEIQFDYVRYPDGGGLAPIYSDRYETIEGFLDSARDLLAGRVMISADLFGRVLWGWNEKLIDPIGQSLEMIAPSVDFISPMLYPSHYVEDYYKSDPYRVITEALESGKGRVKARFRPFLQAFALSIPDGMTLEDYIRLEIKAAQDAGADGYLFWNPSCDYAPLYQALD